MEPTQDYWIQQLALEPHPEGGYFKQVLCAEQQLLTDNQVKRPYYTSIYFLLTAENPSHFHRLSSDEVWYYHAGAALTIHLLYPNGQYETIVLGTQLDKGQVLQAVVPKQVIFGSTVEYPGTFAVVSCMVSPGFDYEDFQLFTKQELVSHYPQHQFIIDQLAYEELPAH